MQENVITLIRSLSTLTCYGIVIGIEFGITILLILAILDIFKVTTK